MRKIFLSSAILIFITLSLVEGSHSAMAQPQNQSPWLRMGNNAALSSPSDFIGYSFTNSPDLIFKTSATERLRITADGKIGIGIAPTEAFELGFGNARFPDRVDVGGIIAVGPPMPPCLNCGVGGDPPTRVEVNGGMRVQSLSGSGNVLVTADNDGIMKPLQIPNNPYLVLSGNGTFSPIPVFDWQVSGSNLFMIPSGNVGIGTTFPTEKLTVEGNIRVSNCIDANCLNVTGKIRASAYASNSPLIFEAPIGTERARIDDATGNVGIGINNPSEKLDVNGNIRINEYDIFFRSVIPDGNHGLGWYGVDAPFGMDKKFAAVDVNGPVLFGWNGGALGVKQGTSEKIALKWDENGNVGVGTTTPTEKLEVGAGGTLRLSDGAGYLDMKATAFGGEIQSSGPLKINFDCRQDVIIGGPAKVGCPHSLTMYANANVEIAGQTHVAGNIIGDGEAIFAQRVGIGTSLPNCQLQIVAQPNVNGLTVSTNHTNSYGYNILAEVDMDGTKAIAVSQGNTDQFVVYGNGHVFAHKVRVTLGAFDFPDYVFDENYLLMPLETLQQYLLKNKHLPEYPTEKEVTKNGLDLGDISVLQQKSIEEIFLHLIALKEENKQMKLEIEKMKKEIEKPKK